MKISQILSTGSANRPKKNDDPPLLVRVAASQPAQVAARLNLCRHHRTCCPAAPPPFIFSTTVASPNYIQLHKQVAFIHSTKTNQIEADKILLNKNQMMTAVCLNYH
jgi:hypothetical protein